MHATPRTTTSRPTGAPAGGAPPTEVAGTAVPSRLLRGTLLTSSTLTIMAAAVIAPSLPEMRQVFSAAPAADVLVRLALTITSLAIGITAPLAGTASDRVGRGPVLVSALVLYAVAGVAGFFISDLYLLLASRVLLGVAVGGIMTSVTALISDLFAGPRRGAFLGLQSAFASLGGVVFLTLAGVLAGIAWDAPFWIYAVSLLVVPFAVLALIRVRPGLTARSEAQVGAPSVPDLGQNREQDHRPGTGGVLAVIYTLAWAGTLIFFMAPTQLPFLLQRFEVSTTVIGIAVAASTASSAVAAIGYSRLRRSASQEAVTALSLGLLGAGWCVIGMAGSLALIVGGVLVGGIGVGLIIPNLNLWVSELVTPARRGRVLGGLVSAIFLGQFVSPLLLAPVISALGISGAFLAAGALAVAVGVVLAPVLPRLSTRTTPRRG